MTAQPATTDAHEEGRTARSAIWFLGLIAFICVVALVITVNSGESDTTTVEPVKATATVPEWTKAAGKNGSSPTVSVAAPKVTQEQGLRSNALTVLGSTAAAAIGGIAGMVGTGRRKPGGADEKVEEPSAQ